MINKIYFQKTVKMISFSNILLLVMEKIILHAFLSVPLWDWWYGCVSWQSQLVNIFHFKIADLSAKQVTIIMFKFRTWRFLIILIDTLFLDVSKYQLWMATYVLIYLRNLTTNFVTNFLIPYLRKKVFSIGMIRWGEKGLIQMFCVNAHSSLNLSGNCFSYHY